MQLKFKIDQNLMLRVNEGLCSLRLVIKFRLSKLKLEKTQLFG